VSGWQEQALADPVTLKAGAVYVASVGVHDYYVVSRNQLGQAWSTGPLSTVADGANGVFSETEGVFPDESWSNSNYFVDVATDFGAGVARVPAVSSATPVDGTDGIATNVHPRATFSTPLDPSTVGTSSFTLHEVGGAAVSATVSYDEPSNTATLVPSSALTPATSYVATLSTAIKSDDGAPMAAAYTWHFTTADPNQPALVSASPSDGATQVTASTAVRATLSLALNPASVTAAHAHLTGPSGSVPASVAYDAVTSSVTITPDAPLAPSTAYTAELTGLQTAGGVTMDGALSWSFTTSACPCSLFSAGDAPAMTQKPTQDGRWTGGPYSYEMGVKVTVSQPATLTALKFYKSPGEGGTHTGRIWTANGEQIAQVTFGGESGSGWQQQSLTTPIALSPGQTYVVSVGINDYYSVTIGGFATAVTGGPLSSVADGANGVYAGAAGTFPTETWGSSNYWIDAVVR
jgi:uncharacterized protein DUF4082/Big-like domain-containing protein